MSDIQVINLDNGGYIHMCVSSGMVDAAHIARLNGKTVEEWLTLPETCMLLSTLCEIESRELVQQRDDILLLDHTLVIPFVIWCNPCIYSYVLSAISRYKCGLLANQFSNIHPDINISEFHMSSVVYIGIVETHDGLEYGKFGFTDNIVERHRDHNNYYKKFTLYYIRKCADNTMCERLLRQEINSINAKTKCKIQGCKRLDMFLLDACTIDKCKVLANSIVDRLENKKGKSMQEQLAYIVQRIDTIHQHVSGDYVSFDVGTQTDIEVERKPSQQDNATPKKTSEWLNDKPDVKDPVDFRTCYFDWRYNLKPKIDRNGTVPWLELFGDKAGSLRVRYHKLKPFWNYCESNFHSIETILAKLEHVAESFNIDQGYFIKHVFYHLVHPPSEHSNYLPCDLNEVRQKFQEHDLPLPIPIEKKQYTKRK